MTILIGRDNGVLGPRVTLDSTDTGDRAIMTPEEWTRFVRRIKAGALDHIEQHLKAEQKAAVTPRETAYRRGLTLADVLRERVAEYPAVGPGAAGGAR